MLSCINLKLVGDTKGLKSLVKRSRGVAFFSKQAKIFTSCTLKDLCFVNFMSSVVCGEYAYVVIILCYTNLGRQNAGTRLTALQSCVKFGYPK